MWMLTKLMQDIIDNDEMQHFNKTMQEVIDKIANTDKLKDTLPVILSDALVKCYYPYNNYKFKICASLDAVVSCDYYDYSDIRETDNVLDLGACVGAFSIFASSKAKHIYAVEPLFGDILLENLILNKIRNVTIYECAIGPQTGTGILNYDPRTKAVPVLTFSDLLKNFPKCDFLKLDCEMAEWLVTANELAQFRRVEVEVHNFDGKHNYKDYEKRIEDAGFEYTSNWDPRSKNKTVRYIHAFKDK